MADYIARVEQRERKGMVKALSCVGAEAPTPLFSEGKLSALLAAVELE